MNLEPVVAVTKSVSTLRAIAAGIVIVIVMGLLIAIQQIRVVSLQGNLTLERGATATALSANAESQATITTLRAEAARNETYRLDLDKRLKASEQKAIQARKDFEDLKRKSPAVRKWADQPLPDGLRGKPASTGKDNDVKARTP
jgi:LysB family phage lysis regulatory protein